MRSWDKYCEDTEKTFKHFRDCIWQPVYITGLVGANSAYSSHTNPLLSPYLGRIVIVEVRPHGEMPPINISDEEFDDRVDKGSLVLLRGLKGGLQGIWNRNQFASMKMMKKTKIRSTHTKQDSNSCWSIL